MHQQHRSDFQCENPQKALDQRTVVDDFAFYLRVLNLNNGCVTYTVALPFTLRRILRQKKNYGNSNIFHHAKT
jgi:hypothetical protein